MAHATARGMRFQISLLALLLMIPACRQPPTGATVTATASTTATSTPTTTIPAGLQDDATRRQEFAKSLIGELLDTELYEVKGQLTLAVKNPNQDDDRPWRFNR